MEWGAYFFVISVEDIKRWQTEGRWDIIQYLEFLDDGSAFGWFNSKTKERISRCPFLCKEKSGYLCKIHETKPKRCKEYYCALVD